MTIILKLANRLEEARKSLFNQGWSFEDANEMVKLSFEETGLKFNDYLELDREEIKKAIEHIENEFLN